MQYKVECDLENFEAWSGGKDTLDTLIDKDVCDEIQQLIEDTFLDECPTETEINDFLWFERDFIAQYLGYTDWDAFEYGDEEEDDEEEEEEFTDTNGTTIQIGDTVVWDDEAGENEDGSKIEFKVVDEDGNGYFNIAYDGEENPERWAYCGELEIV